MSCLNKYSSSTLKTPYMTIYGVLTVCQTLYVEIGEMERRLKNEKKN